MSSCWAWRSPGGKLGPVQGPSTAKVVTSVICIGVSGWGRIGPPAGGEGRGGLRPPDPPPAEQLRGPGYCWAAALLQLALEEAQGRLGEDGGADGQRRLVDIEEGRVVAAIDPVHQAGAEADHGAGGGLAHVGEVLAGHALLIRVVGAG